MEEKGKVVEKKDHEHHTHNTQQQILPLVPFPAREF